MSGTPLRITIVGASRPGCEAALCAHGAGHHVTLIDEHPQGMGQMAFDAPWFYGAALPAALANGNAVAQSVLEGSPELAACLEAGIDVRVGTIAWGAFQNGPNSQHIGTPKVGLVDAGGNAMLDHDRLILAPGTRDFVPSFRGAELPGVFGVKAGMAFLDLYQCYEGARTLVLGTSTRAADFVRRALARGVRIAGMVEPGQDFAAGPAVAAEIAALGIKVHYGMAILAAEGGLGVTGARLAPVAGGDEVIVACDSICAAIGVLPNIELPAAMGCRMRLDGAAGSWVPVVDAAGRTSLEGVFWLSHFTGVDVGRTLAALAGQTGAAGAASSPPDLPPPDLPPPDLPPPDLPPPGPPAQGDYLRGWIAALNATGGGAVTLCKCESVTRDGFLGLQPPPYLKGAMRHPHSPLAEGGPGPCIHQDQTKRLTRVGMGHCQGRRCRDEAALLLSLHFSVGLKDIEPGSYRFPVRPINLSQIAADEAPGQRWSYWMHEPELAVGE